MQQPPEALPAVLVCSGKGGVGKSTLAVRIARAMATSLGRPVGIVDADVYGPDALAILGRTRTSPAGSVRLMGTPANPLPALRPVDAGDVQVASLQQLLGEEQPFALAGSFLGMIAERLVRAEWSPGTALLVVDMPPGTGEVFDAVLPLVRAAGALVVVTPQEAAHLDARKLVTFLAQKGVRVLGGVENMASITCRQCGADEPLFEPAAPDRTIWHRGVDCLGSVPFDRGASVPGAPPVQAVDDAVASIAARVRDAIGLA